MKERINSPRLKKLFIVSIVLMIFAFTLSSCSCAKVDPELVIALFCSEAQSTISVEECKALGALYNSTNGNSWVDHTGWFDDENPCSWFGITCENNQVAEIRLSDNNLTGVLPDELGDLSALKHLVLQGGNSIGGHIPFASLGKIPNLEALYLAGNDFTGSLCGVGQLSQLKALHLGNNGLRGPIPAELGQLDQLEHLFLFSNYFSGPIPPEIGNLDYLINLSLSGNDLTGSIPREIGSMDRLSTLDLQGNDLTGKIPPELGNLDRLSYLRLYSNELSGPIPDELTNLTNLKVLWLNDNSLTGRLPDDFGNLVNLEFLQLGPNNQFHGTLPLSMINMSVLDHFPVPGETLCVPDDPDFQQWMDGVNPEFTLATCGFDCGLQDTIPTKECAALQSFYQSAGGPGWTTNTGWPDHANPCTWHGVSCQGGHVTALELHGNNLVGEIPPAISSLSSLELLRLGDNQLSGPLPLELQLLSSLIHLEYDNTSICEPDAQNFRSWLFRPGLDREGTDDKCAFSCSLQEDLPVAECAALQALYESTNGPDWTSHTHWMEHRNPCVWQGVECASGHVTKLDLRENNLVGNLPPEIGDLPYLSWLWLDRNQLTGELPEGIVGLPRLERLWLSENDLTGTLPSGIGGLCNLSSIYLQENQIGGYIPTEISCLPELRYINLSNNDFRGIIPPELGKLPVLQELKLTSNNLSGIIPSELANLTILSKLNLDDNRLEGKIPRELGNLTNLGMLRLSSNELTGRVPEELGNIAGLQWLQLDHNLLYGAIPNSLTNMYDVVEFEYHETNLCTPSDSAMQVWLNSIGSVVDTGVSCNTRVGSAVVVTPADENNPGSSPIEITFNNVKLEGSTTLSTAEGDLSPPFGFKIGSPPTYYIVETTASYSQGYTICINFSGVEYDQVEDLSIQQYQLLNNSSQGTWKTLDSDIDIGSSEVCAEGNLLFTFE